MTLHPTDFSTGSVTRNILEVALPMTAAQILNLMYNIIDRIYLGRMPGSGALALTGVGLCFPIITMITAFSLLFGSGGAPLCAIRRGEGNPEEAQRIMGNSFSMLVLTGLLLTFGGLLFHRPLLYLFGASEVTFPFASRYITIYLMGSVPVMVSLGMNPFINSQGFGRTGMLTVLLGAVANLILDPIFIFALDMGIRGAALATVISQMLSALWVLRFLTGEACVLRLTRDSMRVSLSRLRSIVGLGLSGFIMGLTNSLVQVVCNSTVQAWGGDLYVGVMTILNSVREIFTMPVSGLTTGAQPVMSFNYGEKAYGRVRQAMRFITLAGMGYTLCAWMLVFFFPTLFIRIFSSDPHLVRATVPALHIYFFGFFMMSLQFAGQTVFVSLGKARQAIFFSLFRKAVIVVPLTLFLPRFRGLGVNGVYAAEPISNLVGGLACFITMLCLVLPELREHSAEKTASGSQ